MSIGVFATIAVALALCWSSPAWADETQSTQASPALATTTTVPLTPVYRLYNPSSTEHLYTSDGYERSVLISNGWNDEGIGWYAPPIKGAGVYRLYNPYSGDHLFTTDVNECATLTSRMGWVMDYSGRPLFLSGGDTPVLRLYLPSSGAHLITKDTHEYNVLGEGSWSPEGIKFYGSDGATTTEALPSGDHEITTVASESSIEATVTLTGSGSGYEAKLTASSDQGSVAFGLRFDKAGTQPYVNTTSLVVENLAGASAADQKLVYAGFGEPSRAYRLLMTVQPNGVVDCYLNGARVKSVKNDLLADRAVTLSVAGAGAAVGDKVTATFNDIRLKTDGQYVDETVGVWSPLDAQGNAGLTAQTETFPGRVVIDGTVTQLAPGEGTVAYRGVGSVPFEFTLVPQPEPEPDPDAPDEDA